MFGRAPTSGARAALMMTLHVTVPVLVPVPVHPSLSVRRRRRGRRRILLMNLAVVVVVAPMSEAQVPEVMPVVVDGAVVLSALIHWMTSA